MLHISILKVLYEYNRLPRKMIQDLAGFTHRNRCQEALKELYDHRPKYVDRVAYHPLNQHAGKSDYVYSLAKRGAQELSGIWGRAVNTPKLSKKSESYLRHTIELNQFRIFVEKACHDHSDVQLDGIIPEYKGKLGSSGIPIRTVQEKVKPNNRYGSPEIFIPDMVFVLSRGNNKALFFTEIDLGSEKKSQLVSKVLDYEAYFKQKGFKSYSRKFKYEFKGFRLLFVGDLTQFQKVITELNDTNIDLGYVWGGDIESLNESNFFDKVWVIGDRDNSKRFSLVRSS
ncbi:replication-relaxation family protein [Candidatus Latescibacterota bacterium]